MVVQERLLSNKVEAEQLQQALGDYSSSTCGQLVKCINNLAGLHQSLVGASETEKQQHQAMQLPHQSDDHSSTVPGQYSFFAVLFCFVTISCKATPVLMQRPSDCWIEFQLGW